MFRFLAFAVSLQPPKKRSRMEEKMSDLLITGWRDTVAVRVCVDKGGGRLCLGLGSEWRPMCEQHSIKHTDYQVNTHTQTYLLN